MQLKKLMEERNFCLTRESKETGMVVAKFQLDFHGHWKEENISVFTGKACICS